MSTTRAQADGLDHAETGWWHGGVPGLRPGDLLLPRRQLPMWTGDAAHWVRHPAHLPGRPDPAATVAITTDPWAALAYADDYREPWPSMSRAIRRPGALYLVAPAPAEEVDLELSALLAEADAIAAADAQYPPALEHGAQDRPPRSESAPHLHLDPDYPGHRDRFTRVTRAVVLDVITERVELSERDFVRHLAPYQQWSPGEPVYTASGHLTPSPSMQAAGISAATLADLGRWVPLSTIHVLGHRLTAIPGWERTMEWTRRATPRRDALQLPTTPQVRLLSACALPEVRQLETAPKDRGRSWWRRRGRPRHRHGA